MQIHLSQRPFEAILESLLLPMPLQHRREMQTIVGGHDHGIGIKQIDFAFLAVSTPDDDATIGARPPGRLVHHLSHVGARLFGHRRPNHIVIDLPPNGVLDAIVRHGEREMPAQTVDMLDEFLAKIGVVRRDPNRSVCRNQGFHILSQLPPPIARSIALATHQARRNLELAEECGVQPERLVARIDLPGAFEILALHFDGGAIQEDRNIAATLDFPSYDRRRDQLRDLRRQAAQRVRMAHIRLFEPLADPSTARHVLQTQQFLTDVVGRQTILILKRAIAAGQRSDQRPQVLDIGSAALSLLARQKRIQRLEHAQPIRRRLQKREAAARRDSIIRHFKLDMTTIW